MGITFDGNFRYETGEALTGDDDVTMTLDNLSTSGKNIFGSYNGANGKNFSLYIYGSASSGSYFRYGDQLKRPKYGTGKRTITFGKSGTSGFADDSDVTPDEFMTPANVYIGMLPNSSSAAYIGDIIGSIIVSNRLEWIPCERESDGTIGYYEKYNDSFLEPVGSGTPVSLGYDDSHLTVLSVDGTAEVLTIGEQTATVENLLAVDDITDEQNIISGAVTRRCEALISDGTTPSGRYIGEVGEGNIIVKVRETGYEGDVATFEATEAEPLNGLTANISPIQDLHGYDNPWPAGGGKNKINFANCTAGKTAFGLTSAMSGEYFRFTGTCSSGGAHTWVFGTINSEQQSVAENLIFKGFVISGDSALAITAISYNSSNGTLSVNLGGLVTNQAYDFMLGVVAYEGSTAPTAWSPYSNICPITGWTGAKVTRTGKNLLAPRFYRGVDYNKRVGQYVLYGAGLVDITESITKSGNTFSQTGSSWGLSMCLIADVGQLTGKQVRVSGTFTGALNVKNGLRSAWYFTDENYIVTRVAGAMNINPPYVLTPAEGEKYLIWYINSSASGTITLDSPMLELSSTATAYEPYAGNTYTIQLGQTVYGGTLDVTQGKMVVDRAYALLDDESKWETSTSTTTPYVYNQNFNDRKIFNDSYTGLICSAMPVNAANQAFAARWSGATSKTFGIKATSPVISIDVFKDLSRRGELSIAYLLATPIEITLTPTQIETLLGMNNIWSDAGAVKAYVADAELIEHVTAQPLRTAEGSNTVSVTSAVDPVQLEIDYYKDE